MRYCERWVKVTAATRHKKSLFLNISGISNDDNIKKSQFKDLLVFLPFNIISGLYIN